MMSRLQAIRAAAAAYADRPGAGVQRIGWQDISADVFDCGPALGIAVKGTDPEKLANVARDMEIKKEPCRDHPEFGEMFEGALNAAEGLKPLIEAIAGDRPLFVLGHSLGGQIAVDLAALFLPRVVGFWGFDPPKSGGSRLAAALTGTPGNIDRFAGSIVNRWPFDQGVHVRMPVAIGDWTPDWWTAHSIVRAEAWVAVREAVPVQA